MSRKGGAGLPNDVPWRASSAAKPILKTHHSPFLRIPRTSYSNYAFSLMKHEDPIGSGLGKEAVVEAGQTVSCLDKLHPSSYLVLRLFAKREDIYREEAKGRDLKSIGRFMDSAVDLMNKSFIDR